MWVSDMFYSTPCSCKCIFIFVRIDIHAYIGGLQRLNTQRHCVRNCALRGLAHRNFSSQVLTIRALYDAFEIVISRIVTFLKSYRNCLVSLDLRSSFEIVTPELHHTTSYHPQANVMVERFHRDMKAALRSRLNRPNSVDELPWVLPSLYAQHQRKICTPSLRKWPIAHL